MQHARPSLAFKEGKIRRKFKDSSAGDMKEGRKLVGLAKEREVSMEMRRLRGPELVMEMLVDAEDGKSQTGYLLVLVDGRGYRCPVLWKSKMER